MENKLNKIVMQRPVEVLANSDLYTYKGEEKIDDNSPLIVVSETKSLHLVIKDEGMSVQSKKVKTKVIHVITLILTYIFLMAMALLFIFPFYWMIITSFKSGAEIRGFLPGYEGVQTFWPINFQNNYANLFERFDFGTYLSNTLIVGVCTTIGTVLTCILSAFAFARLNFKGKETMFALLLSTMMIPGEMMVITNFVSVSRLGWLDGSRIGAYMAMIIPFITSVFYTYLLRQILSKFQTNCIWLLK